MTYDPTSGTAVIGSGLIWDDVYERLQDHNVTVIGGRVSGVSGHHDLCCECVPNTITSQVGVGGFVLGGGLSLNSRIYRYFVH